MKPFNDQTLWKLTKCLKLACRIKNPAIREGVRNCIIKNDLISKIPKMEDEMTTRVGLALMETNYEDQELFVRLLKRFTTNGERKVSETGMRLVGFLSRAFPHLADWEQNEAFFDYLHKQSRLMGPEKARLIYSFSDLGIGSPKFWGQVEESVLYTMKSYDLLPNKSTKQASIALHAVYANLLSIKSGVSRLSQDAREQIYQFLIRVIDDEEVKVSDKLNAMMMITRRLSTTRMEALIKGYRCAKDYMPDRILQESLNQLQNLIWRSHHLLSGQARECEEEIFMGIAHIIVNMFKYVGFRKAVFKTDSQSLTLTLKHGTELFSDFKATLDLPSFTMRPLVEFMTDLVNSYHQSAQPDDEMWRQVPELADLKNPFITVFNQESSLCILLLMACPGITEEARKDLLSAVKVAVDLQDLVLTNPRRFGLVVYAIKERIFPWTATEQRALLQGLKAGEFGLHLIETNVRAQQPWKLKLYEDDAKVFVFLKRLSVVATVARECGAEAELHEGLTGLYAECLKELGEELQTIKERLKAEYGFEIQETDNADEENFPTLEEGQTPDDPPSISSMLITEWKNWTRSISILSSWLSGSFTYLNVCFQSERYINNKDHLPVLEEVFTDILMHALQNLDHSTVRSAFCKFVWENGQILNHRLDLITLAAILKEDVEGVTPEEWLRLYKQSNRTARKHYNLAPQLLRDYSLRCLALSASLGISVLKNGIRNAYNPENIQFSTSVFESNISGLQIWSAETIIKSWISSGSEEWTEPAVGLSHFGETHNTRPDDLVRRSVSPLKLKTQQEIQRDVDGLATIVPAEWKAESAVDLLVLLCWPRPRFEEEDRFQEVQKELGEILGTKLNKLVENDYHRHLARVTIQEVRKMQEEDDEHRRILSNPEASAYNLPDYLSNIAKFHQIPDSKQYLKMKKRSSSFNFESEFNNLNLDNQYHLLDNELEEYEAEFSKSTDYSSSFKKSSKSMYLWGEAVSSPETEQEDKERQPLRGSDRSEGRPKYDSSFKGRAKSDSSQILSSNSSKPAQQSNSPESEEIPNEGLRGPKPVTKVGWVIGNAVQKQEQQQSFRQTRAETRFVKRAPSFEKYIVQTYGPEIMDHIKNKGD